MTLGIALGQELGLVAAQRDALVAYARDRGYSSAWTNARAARDPFDACARWTTGAMTAGISVVPLDAWEIRELAGVAAETAARARGFLLGVGSGGKGAGALRLVRDAVAALRRDAPGVPLYVGALGPRMLRLAGEIADGVALNWCSAERVAWSRDRVAEGARAAGRDLSAVRVIEYIRVCVDSDEAHAREALAAAMLGYALVGPRRPRDRGYRMHFTAMGFDALLGELESRRDAGEDVASLARDVPAKLLGNVGVAATASTARAAFARLAEGLDLPIVRVVAAGDVAQGARAAIDACAPR